MECIRDECHNESRGYRHYGGACSSECREMLNTETDITRALRAQVAALAEEKAALELRQFQIQGSAECAIEKLREEKAEAKANEEAALALYADAKGELALCRTNREHWYDRHNEEAGKRQDAEREVLRLRERVSDLEDRLMEEHEGSPVREEARRWEMRAQEKEDECAEWKERALKAEEPR